jgi:ABC-type transport system involved in multi-copper enzyme maturation permease subunit
MKFLAILKDSLREALDTKVFYVMAGFSLLVILLVASIGYRPVTVQGEARRLTDQLTWLMRTLGKMNQQDTLLRWSIEDFEETRPGSAPWDTGYRFTITLDMGTAEDAEVAKQGQDEVGTMIETTVRQHFSYLKGLKVKEVKSRLPTEMRYLVSADGSNITRRQDWPHEPVVLFLVPLRGFHSPVSHFVKVCESNLINQVGAGIALLVSTIITAFFIPNMLRKGTVDLLIVKPIQRWLLLLYKYIGGMTFMFLNTMFIVVGIWLVLGLRTGLWGPGFLVSIVVLTFEFALYYAVSTLFAVVTRSPIVAILMSCLAWAVFAFLIGYGYQVIDMTRKLPDIVKVNVQASGEEKPAPLPPRILPDWVYSTADIIHLVTPHLKDLDVLTEKLILDDLLPAEDPQRKSADNLYVDFHWTETLSVTALYILALLGVSCWWFAQTDY